MNKKYLFSSSHAFWVTLLLAFGFNADGSETARSQTTSYVANGSVPVKGTMSRIKKVE
jgi:hypothetical protein